MHSYSTVAACALSKLLASGPTISRNGTEQIETLFHGTGRNKTLPRSFEISHLTSSLAHLLASLYTTIKFFCEACLHMAAGMLTNIELIIAG